MSYTSDYLIDGLGGTYAVARLLSIAPPSVSEWRGKPLLSIPKDKRILLAHTAEKSGLLTRSDMVPDGVTLIWPELAEKEPV